MAKFKVRDKVVWNGGAACAALLVKGRVYEVIPNDYNMETHMEVRDTVETDITWMVRMSSFDLAPPDTDETREKVLKFIQGQLQDLTDDVADGFTVGPYEEGSRAAYHAVLRHLALAPRLRVELVPLSAD